MAGCGGFTCSKNALAALNVLYVLVALLLISVAGYGKMVAMITSLKIMGGIIACGVFLMIIAIVGLIGAIKHHQVMLFFYMIVLFLLFLIQFAVACACLAVNTDQQKAITQTGWQKADNTTKTQVQNYLDCCGITKDYQNLYSGHEGKEEAGLGHPSCVTVPCCVGKKDTCCQAEYPGNATTATCNSCHACWDQIEPRMKQALKIAGGIGLFFSFTEIIGVWLALRYRNQKDPRANPSAFL